VGTAKTTAKKRRKPKAARKEESLRLRLTAAEKEAFTAAAEKDGRDLSGWLRFIASRESGLLASAPLVAAEPTTSPKRRA
jgi:hypothetical protein